MRRLFFYGSGLLELIVKFFLLIFKFAVVVYINDIKLTELLLGSVAAGILVLFGLKRRVSSPVSERTKLRWDFVIQNTQLCWRFDCSLKHSMAPLLSFSQTFLSQSSMGVFVGEKSPWFATHVKLESALLSHRLKDRNGIRRTAKFHLINVMLGLVLGYETHIVELFVPTGGAHSIESLSNVHVDVRGHETLFCVVDPVGSSDRAVVKLVDIATVEVTCNVKHFGLFNLYLRNILIVTIKLGQIK